MISEDLAELVILASCMYIQRRPGQPSCIFSSDTDPHQPVNSTPALPKIAHHLPMTRSASHITMFASYWSGDAATVDIGELPRLSELAEHYFIKRHAL